MRRLVNYIFKVNKVIEFKVKKLKKLLKANSSSKKLIENIRKLRRCIHSQVLLKAILKESLKSLHEEKKRLLTKKQEIRKYYNIYHLAREDILKQTDLGV